MKRPQQMNGQTQDHSPSMTRELSLSHHQQVVNSHHSRRLSTQSHTLSHRQTPSFAGLFGALPGATHVTVSRSSVIFDGQNTHVEAEEQRFEDGQWTQQRIEGTWSGDQSRAAIETLARGRAPLGQSQPSERTSTFRPLPVGALRSHHSA